MNKIQWSRDSILSHANGYQDPVTYVCGNCGAAVEETAKVCPACKEELENEKVK